ncbi:MAG: EAL domain-containing protein [Wenzhouxiangellaceae bacterium]|nr:EAL domain-containing protein [Wenzhouxiangellaceae bacterium]
MSAEQVESSVADHGLARVVRAPTLIQHLELKCVECVRNPGDSLPPAVGWILLDQSASLREQLGFTGLAQLLHAVHERVRGQLSSEDLTARFGFDALGLLLASQNGDRDYRDVAAALLKAVNRNLFELGDQAVAVTCSIAIAPALESLRPAESNLVRSARKAEKIAEDGGNRWEVEALQHTVDESPARLYKQLHHAIEGDTLRVVCQPLLATSDDDAERIQILPRLEDADGKLIPAAKFIPLAAERGILEQLDAWMVRFAIRLLSRRNREGDQLPTLFLHQSITVVDDPDARARLLEDVGELQTEPGRLVLEFDILELKPRLKTARTALAELQKSGIRIALTSIDEKIPEAVVLRHLPADYLRMKANFARRLVHDEALAERFRAFAKLTHDAGRLLIVPMLENAEEVARIWEMDVDLIQGNFIEAAGDPLKL